MPHDARTKAKGSWIPYIGLFIALFAMVIARQAVAYFSPTLIFTAAIWKELLIWLSAIALLVLIRRGERLPLTSIGIGTSRWWKSILWGFATAMICGLVGASLAALTGYGLGRAWSVTIPLIIFSVGHWTGGLANILIALALGAILTAFYLWRRDLIANMIGHFLVDFVVNVLPKLFS